MTKSKTDRHWNERALSEPDDARVNIHDTVQLDLELDFIFAQLPADGRVLEIGCGNGYVTRQLRERARHVDAFDYAENMVSRARANYGEPTTAFSTPTSFILLPARRAPTTRQYASGC